MKKHSSLLYTGFSTLIVLAGLYKITAAFWNVRWFDSAMHFLGALSIGLLALWVWYSSGLFGLATPSKREAFVAAVIFAMLVGLWWEYFEYAHGIANPIGNYRLDTWNDVLADFVGAMVAGIWGGARKFYE
jgi:VanZ family protein